MKSQKFLILSVSIVWLLSTIVALASGAPGEKQLFISSLPVNIESYQESDSFFSIHAEYPQFQTADPNFNQEIASLISDKIDSFKKESLENWKARLDTMPADKPLPKSPQQPFTFIASWDSAQLNNTYLSLVIKIYYFTGGAHGNEEIHTFNYDMVQRKTITIDEFFDSPQEALERISIISAEDITSQLKSREWKMDDDLEEMLKQGTAPSFDNFKNFNFDFYNLILYFQKYQVAPGAVGSLTVTISKQSLQQNSLRSDYLK